MAPIQSMRRDFTRKVVKNTLFNLYARLWFLSVNILLIPFILSKLGNEEYGIWVLISVFVGYVGLVDLGFGISFAKYIAEYDARGDAEGVSGVLSAGLTVYLVVAAVVLILVLSSIDVILGFFNIPHGLEEKTRYVLQLGIMTYLLINFTGVYQSVINGLQRMEVSSGLAVFTSVCYAIGCVIALGLGFGMVGLAVNQLITQGIGAIASAYWAHRLYPGLRFSRQAVRKHFPILFRYGLNLQVSSIAVLINFQFDKLLVNRFIDAAHVTFYDIGSRIPVTVRSFPLILISALTPAAAELEVRKGKTELYELFLRASKYVSAVAFPLFFGAIVTSRLIIEAWVGPGYDISVGVMRILCIGYLFNIVVGSVSPLVQGMGRPDFQRNADALCLLLNIVLSVFFVTQYGFWGAPVGTTLALFIASMYYIWSFHQFMERPLLPFLKRTCLKPALCAFASGALALLFISVLSPYASHGRIAALLIFLTAGCIFAISYLSLLFKVRFLDAGDMALLGEHLPFMSSIRIG